MHMVLSILKQKIVTTLGNFIDVMKMRAMDILFPLSFLLKGSLATIYTILKSYVASMIHPHSVAFFPLIHCSDFQLVPHKLLAKKNHPLKGLLCRESEVQQYPLLELEN